jgi:type IV secretory pathway VirB10-like protein
VLVGLVAVAMVVAQVMATMHKKAPATGSTENTMDPYWARQTFEYKREEPPPPATPKPPEDTISPELAGLRREQAALRAELELLKSRKPLSPAVPQKGGGTQAVSQKAAAPRAVPAPTQMIAHAVAQDAQGETRGVRTYLLAPGTFLPCTVETTMNSEVEGYFTAKVNQNVYDTATHARLLVSQGSTIVGNTNSSQLVYGNERMDTVSLTLTLANGRSVPLGNAPVTDQEGMAGLTGDVDQHFWRLFGAVFVGGALKGGMDMLHMGAAQVAGAGQVASGIATYGNQATTRIAGRAMDTRPTIKVHAGQLCNVLLTKELKLPAMWQ